MASSGAGSSITSDPTAAIRADPRRPGECPGCGSAIECEHDTWWCTKWSCKYHDRWSIPRENWPHVPQPAPADKPTILPPAEMPEALRPYWTPESRVYRHNERNFRDYFWMFPQRRFFGDGEGGESVFDEESRKSQCTLLPNRTVTTESILGTASAAKAVEQGVADAVEGRTVKIPDPLDQLAAEAQAEGEYGTAWERLCELAGHDAMDWMPITPKEFRDFLSAECERAVERAKASPRLSEQLDRMAQTEQFKNCQFDGVDPDSIVVIDGGKPSDYRLADEPKTIRGTGGPITPPTPRRTAREVAREAADKLYAYTGQGWEFAAQVIQAAIERDRNTR